MSVAENDHILLQIIEMQRLVDVDLWTSIGEDGFVNWKGAFDIGGRHWRRFEHFANSAGEYLRTNLKSAPSPLFAFSSHPYRMFRIVVIRLKFEFRLMIFLNLSKWCRERIAINFDWFSFSYISMFYVQFKAGCLLFFDWECEKREVYFYDCQVLFHFIFLFRE